MKTMWKFLSKLWAKKSQNTNQDGPVKYSVESLEDKYIFDFRNYGGLVFTDDRPRLEETSNQSDKPQKIRIKPIDVLEELEKMPTPFSCNMIDEKLLVLEDKKKLIVQDYAKREVKGLIERLKNRKKYEEFRSFFERFQNTDDEAIEKLLQKYDLVMKSSDIFIPEFPDDAIAIMKEYTEQCEKLCGLKPVFYVIAEPDKFRKAFEQRDPILLVQSPFGFFWQILGAWDKEMILLGEL